MQAFWDTVEISRVSADVTTPTLPRQRKVLVGESAPEYPSSIQDHYRRIYFEAIDLVSSGIQNLPKIGIYSNKA